MIENLVVEVVSVVGDKDRSLTAELLQRLNPPVELFQSLGDRLGDLKKMKKKKRLFSHNNEYGLLCVLLFIHLDGGPKSPLR